MTVFFVLCLLVLLALLFYYLQTAALRPDLSFQQTEHNQRLLQAIPRLRRRFWVTPWLINGHLQLLALGLRKAFGRRIQYHHTQTLQMEDGGTTALNWYGENLPDDTPVLLVLHTITGSPHSMRGFVRDVQRDTGWRVVLCQRRGHGDLRLTSPRFNTMGDTNDLRAHIGLIQQRFPQAPLYAAGVSAGTGLLIRYLGEEGDATPIRAAFAYCPGYDISVAFQRSKAFFSRTMAKKLIRQFVLPNQTQLQGLRSYQQLANAADLHEFHSHLYECAGYGSHGEFLQSCNPVSLMSRIRIPLLVLNAQDDPVCVDENVRDFRGQMLTMPNTILAVTRRGSHCAHFSGLLPKPWAHRLAADYFRAVHQHRTPSK